MNNRIEEWIFDGIYLARRSRNSFPAVPDTFTLSVTEPTALNSGAGVLRPVPSTNVVNGNVTVATGTVYSDTIINGYVSIQGTGVLENCIVRGPANGSVGDERPIIRTDTATPGTYQNVRFCTVDPQTPTGWMSGIGSKNYHAYRCAIYDTVDGFAVFSTTVDGISATRGEGNFVNRLVQYRPDPVRPRSHTHNDVVQFQGNLGGPMDSVWIGNHFDARLSDVDGTLPLESPRNHINGFTISVGTQTEVNCYVAYNWLYGGIQTFNGGSPDNAAGEVTVINNKFERPGTDPLAPTRALVVHSNSTRITTGNTYIDNGAAVPVGNS